VPLYPYPFAEVNALRCHTLKSLENVEARTLTFVLYDPATKLADHQRQTVSHSHLDPCGGRGHGRPHPCRPRQGAQEFRKDRVWRR
jgi:hypothetical protein